MVGQTETEPTPSSLFLADSKPWERGWRHGQEPDRTGEVSSRDEGAGRSVRARAGAEVQSADFQVSVVKQRVTGAQVDELSGPHLLGPFYRRYPGWIHPRHARRLIRPFRAHLGTAVRCLSGPSPDTPISTPALNERTAHAQW